MRYPATEKLEIIRLVEGSHLGSDSYVERPGWQGVGGMNLRRTVQSYVRPVSAVIDRWPR